MTPRYLAARRLEAPSRMPLTKADPIIVNDARFLQKSLVIGLWLICHGKAQKTAHGLQVNPPSNPLQFRLPTISLVA